MLLCKLFCLLSSQNNILVVNNEDIQVVEETQDVLPYVDPSDKENYTMGPTQKEVKPIKKKSHVLRAALVALAVFTVICGILYPLSVTIAAQVIFPYEANGSIVEVTLKDGTKRIYGSELIGQQYENPKYLFGRVNLGAPSNLSPHSDEFVALVNERIEERKAKLLEVGYVENEDIPDELLTSSGSGVDPHISVEAAYFQIPVIAHVRGISEEEVKQVIDKYTEGRFLGILGEKRVNVLLVNLALDGEI